MFLNFWKEKAGRKYGSIQKKFFLLFLTVGGICLGQSVPSSRIVELDDNTTIEVRKKFDPVRKQIVFESSDSRIASSKEFRNLYFSKISQQRKSFGALGASLREMVAQKGWVFQDTVVVHLRKPSINYLDKTLAAKSATTEQSRSLLQSQPVMRVKDFLSRYIIRNHVELIVQYTIVLAIPLT